MQIGPQCWTCLGGRVRCDGLAPSCLTCKRRGVACAGYGEEARGGGIRSGRSDASQYTEDDSRSRSSRASSGATDTDLSEFTSDMILEPAAAKSPIFSQPVPALYRRAQMIFEGLDYFNKMICPDLVSLESHFNPYKVNIATVDRIPDIYVKVLVSVASFHRLMSCGPDPTPSSALVQRDADVFALRVEALRGLNEKLSLPDEQTSDATLLCVLSLMVASIQASAYTEWRAHLEGARRIIQMRGGLKKIVSVNPYFKPVLTFFMLIDVIGSTTTPSGHGDMPVACNMAMQYWDIEPGVLQYIATTCIPVPDVLFRVITLVNYLRTIAGRPSLCAKRRSGTRMAIQKVVDFSPGDYAAVMRDFDGWSTSGKEVSFGGGGGGGEAREQQPQQGGTSSSSPATDSVPRRPTADLWLGLGVMYRAATLLYALRTLVVDSEDPPAQLLPETMSSDAASSSASSSVDSLRCTTFSALHAALVPVFADPVSMHQVGKLIMWPLFVLGMETEHRDAGRRRFVAEGFSSLSLALGTLGPVGVVNALEVKWRMDAEREEGALPRARWDDYFQGREDFIVF
ncbi:fungal-specific transcription factor domain-containing protein [Pestalotiopsis sp. NC0098]|nr:fungal-specific transcription factor domain-containing protein [Pestalotiopsis sp. NC0098]